MVLGVSKNGIKLAINVLEELSPRGEADQASALCELPIEAGHVCGSRSDICIYLYFYQRRSLEHWWDWFYSD